MTIAAGGPRASQGPSSRTDPRGPSLQTVPARARRAHAPGSGINPSLPSLKAARARDKLLRGFATLRPKCSRSRSACAGTASPDSPDPTLSVPSNTNRGPSGRSRGVILAIPSSINARSPSFKHAAAACGFPPKGSYPLHGGGPFASTDTSSPRSAVPIYQQPLEVEAGSPAATAPRSLSGSRERVEASEPGPASVGPRYSAPSWSRGAGSFRTRSLVPCVGPPTCASPKP